MTRRRPQRDDAPATSALRYHQRHVDLSNINSAHTQMVRFVGVDKTVLEVGPATGYLTRILAERGCRVTCIEQDKDAARIAAPFCERMIIGDVEKLNLRRALSGARFDTVLFGDVLEHLVDPWHVLREISSLLAPGGCVVASVPNVAHGSIRLALLEGRFQYTDTGLLDRTHLRFFTRQSLETLFRDSGYAIEAWQPILLDPLGTEQEVFADDFPRGLVEGLRHDEAARAYQYVVKAKPIASDSQRQEAHGSGNTAVLKSLQGLKYAEERAAQLEALAAELGVSPTEVRWLFLQKDSLLLQKDALLAEKEARLGEKDARLVEQNARLNEKDAWLTEKDARLLEQDARLKEQDAVLGRRLSQAVNVLRLSVFLHLTHQRAFLSEAMAYRRAYGWRAFLSKVAGPQRWLPKLLGVNRRVAIRATTAALAGADAALSGSLDNPPATATLNRTLCFVEGWVLSRGDLIDRVEVQIDGALAGLARLGLPRPDVAAVSDHPNAPICGFQMVLDPASFPPDATEISISATAYDLGGGSLTFPVRKVALQPEERRPDVQLASPAFETPLTTVRTRDSRPASLRVACFAHDLGYGGGQLYLSELLRQMLKQSSFECTVISPAEGPLKKDLQSLGIEVEILAVPPIRDPGQYERGLAALADWLTARRFDAVIANTILAYAPVTAAHQAGIPTIWAIHESFPVPLWCALNGASTPELVQSMTLKIERALGCASAVVFEAEATRQMFLPYADPDRMIKVPYGIDTGRIEQFLAGFDKSEARRLLGFEPHERVITCIGTFEHRKQQTVLAQAFAAIAARHPDARLILIGDFGSEYSHALHQYIKRAQLGDRIKTLPVTPDVYQWYGVSDVFVLVSDIESLPRTFLESMCFGVPVLGTDVFGIPELVEDGASGFIVEVNRLGALVSKLDEALSADAAQLERMGDRARRLIREQYDSAGYATTYLRLIHGLRAGITPRETLTQPA